LTSSLLSGIQSTTPSHCHDKGIHILELSHVNCSVEQWCWQFCSSELSERSAVDVVATTNSASPQSSSESRIGDFQDFEVITLKLFY
jgi:hypothetical protein